MNHGTLFMKLLSTTPGLDPQGSSLQGYGHGLDLYGQGFAVSLQRTVMKGIKMQSLETGYSHWLTQVYVENCHQNGVWSCLSYSLQMLYARKQRVQQSFSITWYQSVCSAVRLPAVYIITVSCCVVYCFLVLPVRWLFCSLRISVQCTCFVHLYSRVNDFARSSCSQQQYCIARLKLLSLIV